MKHQVHPPVQLSLEFELPLLHVRLSSSTHAPLPVKSNVVCFQAYRDVQQPVLPQGRQVAQGDNDPPRLYRGILDSIKHFAY